MIKCWQNVSASVSQILGNVRPAMSSAIIFSYLLTIQYTDCTTTPSNRSLGRSVRSCPYPVCPAMFRTSIHKKIFVTLHVCHFCHIDNFRFDWKWYESANRIFIFSWCHNEQTKIHIDIIANKYRGYHIWHWTFELFLVGPLYGHRYSTKIIRLVHFRAKGVLFVWLRAFSLIYDLKNKVNVLFRKTKKISHKQSVLFYGPSHKTRKLTNRPYHIQNMIFSISYSLFSERLWLESVLNVWLRAFWEKVTDSKSVLYQ